MDTKTTIKEVYHKAKAGQFTEVLRLIKDVEVGKEVALNIVKCVANACYNSLKGSSNIDKDQIYNLLNNILWRIDTLDKCQLIPYLQSVWHIINYMCDKECFEDLTKMEFIIIPTFLKDFSLSNIEEGKHVYQIIVNKLCNSVFRLEKAKTTTNDKDLLGLIRVIFKANSEISGIKECLSVAYNLLNALQRLKIANNQKCEFYYIVLNSLARDFKKSEIYINEIPSLILIFSMIMSDLIEAEEFQAAETFLEHVETRIILSLNQQEFLLSHSMFKLVIAIFPSNAIKMQNNMESYKNVIKALKMYHQNLLLSVIRHLEEALYDLLSYYKSSGRRIWSELPSNTIFNMLRLVRDDMCCHSILASKTCSCGCSLEKNYVGTLKIGCQISGLFKYYLETNKSLPKKLYSEIELWQTYFYEILKEVKAHNCHKWSQIYKELGTYTYNIGTALYHQKNPDFVDIYQCFLKYSIEFEGFSSELIKDNIKEVSFNVICFSEDANCNVEKCMAFAALYCFLYPQKCNSTFQSWWIKSKLKVKEDSTIQQLTLVSVLEKHALTVSGIFNPQKLLTKEKKVELLTYELLRYKAVWKSKESLMAAFSNLIEIAEVPKIAQVILEIFGDAELHLHEEMLGIFSKTRKRIQEYLNSHPDDTLKMALAVLYYYDYKSSSKKTVDKNREEMEKTMIAVKSTQEFEAVPKDPNDECDIVSAYSNLLLGKCTELLKSLNKSVEFIDCSTTQTLEPQIVKNISILLFKIGFEYRLHCFSIKSIQAFELSLRMAKIISDDASQLLTLSFLIENANTKRNFLKEMISQGDKTARLLEKNNLNDMYSKVLAVFHISKAKAFLYDDANLSFESWKIADLLVAANEAKDEYKFLRAQLYILHYKLAKSCSFIAGEHERNPMTLKLHCALDIVISLSQTNMVYSYEHCILFDTAYELANVYYLMRLPRELRAYLKNFVLLTQKLVLPLRCVSFLILLAHSDLMTSKFNHCAVKLNGVNDIFCLNQSHPIILSERADRIMLDTKTVENELEICTSQIQEITLDMPQHTRQYSPSSPALVVESFRVPQFLSHEHTCMCFICLSFEYHQLLLQKYHLDALYNMCEKEEKIAEEFIHGAFMIYKTLMRNYDTYRKKAKRLISESLIPNFDDSFREYYGRILYDYSFLAMRKSRKSEALKVNAELVQLIKYQKLQYVYLFNDALLQRLSYVMPEPRAKSSQIEIETKINNLSITPKENVSIQRTPASKKSTVTVTINGVPEYSPLKRRPRKKCALFTSPVGSEDTSTKSTQGTEITFAVPKYKDTKNLPVLGTPLLGDPQTPKIAIFMDEGPSVRKSRRKQSVNTRKQLEVLEPNECFELIKSTKKSAKKTRKMLNSALALDENSDGLKENCEEDYDNSHQPIIISNNSKTIIQFLEETPGTKESAELISSARKSAKKVRKVLNSAMVFDENVDDSKDTLQQPPIMAGSSKTRSQLLTQKIKTSSRKTSSTALRKRLVDEPLADKLAVPINVENISSDVDNSSSVILESPEHQIASTRSKAVLEKVRLSARKTGASASKTKAGPEFKKNLFGDFLDNEATGSKCMKHTGAIRKSSRHRVL